MTAMSKPELERYNRQRVRAWQEALVKMAETEVNVVSTVFTSVGYKC